MTKIQWTDRTWNPVTGCTRVSEGCRNCYAERLTATRLRQHPKYANLAVMQPSGPRWTNEVRTHYDVLRHPLIWRTPAKVFVCDMSDLFHEAVPFWFIDEVFAVMARCKHLTFQVLTKRPERMADYFSRPWKTLSHGPTGLRDAINTAAIELTGGYHVFPTQELGMIAPLPWPLPNVWLGTSVEDQKTADARIPHLLRCPAVVRFLSAEPLLGPVNIVPYIGVNTHECRCGFHETELELCPRGERMYCARCKTMATTRPGVRWVIVGGESGPAAKPTDIAHIRGIVQQCQAAGVACFVKQLGAKPILKCIADTGSDWPVGVRFSHGVQGRSVMLADPKGGDPDEWPDDLRIREFPTPAEGGAA